MKKSISYILLMAATLLAGCTLSMEDWVEKEEDKGYNVPAVEHNDYFNLTYQYKEDTRSLTEEIQKYITKVEEVDSITSVLYMLDNVPSDWLPQRGGCVVSNCCELFPMGLIAHVESVEHLGGMYKIVTTEADIADAYEDFDLDMDMDIITSKLDPDSSETRTVTRAITRADGQIEEERELVYTDWTMFNRIRDGVPQKRTRALSDDYEHDLDTISDDVTEIQIFKVDENYPLFKEIFDKYKNIAPINKFALGLSHLSTTHMKKIISLKQEREYTDITETNGLKINAMLGHDFVPAGKSATEAQKLEMLKTWTTFQKKFVKGGMAGISFPSGQKIGLDDKIKNTGVIVEIPLGASPIGVIIRLRPVLDFEAGVFISGDIIMWTSKTRSITDIKKGKKVTDKLEKKAKPANTYSMIGGGKISTSVGLELFVGLGKRIGLAKIAGIGGYCKATVDANLTIGTSDKVAETMNNNGLLTIVDVPQNRFTLTGSITAGAQLVAGSADFDLYSQTWHPWGNFELGYYPKVVMDPSIKTKDGIDEDGPFLTHTIKYKFQNLGFFSVKDPYAKINKPVLLVYHKDADITKVTPEVVEPTTKVTKLESGKNYTFQFQTHVLDELVLVPALQDTYGSYTAFPDHQRILTKPHVLISYVPSDTPLSGEYYPIVYQTVGHKSDDDSGWYDYEYALPFHIYNASTLSEFWEDWGVYYAVTIPGRTDRLANYKSLKKSIKRSGNYVVRVGFSSNVTTGLYGEAYLYYVPKITEENPNGGKIELLAYAHSEYTDRIYKIRKKDYGNGILISTNIPITSEFNDTKFYDWESATNSKDVDVTF